LPEEEDTVKRTPRLHRVHRYVTTAAALGLLACAARNGTNPFGGSPQDLSVRIVAINHDFSDVTLTAVGNGVRRRLGVLTGKGEATYTIPWSIPGPLQIEITVLAAGSCTTPELFVDPGELLELQILPEMVRAGRCSGPRGGG
jgi:hypothetical protein